MVFDSISATALDTTASRRAFACCPACRAATVARARPRGPPVLAYRPIGLAPGRRSLHATPFGFARPARPAAGRPGPMPVDRSPARLPPAAGDFRRGIGRPAVLRPRPARPDRGAA